jgi:signal transduction histidine kinase
MSTVRDYARSSAIRLIAAGWAPVQEGAVAESRKAPDYEPGESVRSDERQRLARELHDSALQSLYGIAMAAQAARRTAEGTPESDRLIEALDYIVDQSEAALVELRSLIFGLRPESVAEEGLVAGLRRLTAAVAARHKLDVDLLAETEPDIVNSAKEALYRIAQESLQNIVKHASARVVRVHLVSEGDKVELVIDDDGIGFDSEADHPGHLGLRGMEQRATAQNLELTVRSRPGGGVEVRVRTHALPRRTKQVIPWS